MIGCVGCRAYYNGLAWSLLGADFDPFWPSVFPVYAKVDYTQAYITALDEGRSPGYLVGNFCKAKSAGT